MIKRLLVEMHIILLYINEDPRPKEQKQYYETVT